ncbi:MAG: PD40 domain-containing protein [Lentisphaerae bacterium]|nr:PD40 domain-containing protein [Lentisphaerota bacterium]
MSKRERRFVCAIAATLLYMAPSRAADVHVVKSGADEIPMDISGIAISGEKFATVFLETLRNDLVRSGWFRIVAGSGSAIVAVGRCNEISDRLSVKCRLTNTGSGKTYFNVSYNEPAHEARFVAHKLADKIVESVKSVRGIAATRIAMVGMRDGQRDLYVCSADGHGIIRITKDGVPCLSPKWGFGGDVLLYTSFANGFPDMYEIDMRTNMRRSISARPGINMGGDMSFDGRMVALILSKDGNPELYVMQRTNGRLTRLTRTQHAAEAEPSWSPDGKSIVFVSDSAGSPQLYIVKSNGGRPERPTFRGSENVSPDWGLDGRIAYSSRRGGRYHICVLDPLSGEQTQITRDDADYESPSWAPDSRHIVCSRTCSYHSELYILDTMRHTSVKLFSLEGECHSPSWSP